VDPVCCGSGAYVDRILRNDFVFAVAYVLEFSRSVPFAHAEPYAIPYTLAHAKPYTKSHAVPFAHAIPHALAPSHADSHRLRRPFL